MYELSQFVSVASIAALGLAMLPYLANILGARSVRLMGLASGGTASPREGGLIWRR